MAKKKVTSRVAKKKALPQLVVQCGNCTHWKAYGDRGECRRYPPTMTTETYYTSWMKHPGYRETRSVEKFPWTDIGDVCGEFKSKEIK